MTTDDTITFTITAPGTTDDTAVSSNGTSWVFDRKEFTEFVEMAAAILAPPDDGQPDDIDMTQVDMPVSGFRLNVSIGEP